MEAPAVPEELMLRVTNANEDIEGIPAALVRSKRSKSISRSGMNVTVQVRGSHNRLLKWAQQFGAVS
eukprot:1044886-Prymnesium_polylepis.1